VCVGGGGGLDTFSAIIGKKEQIQKQLDADKFVITQIRKLKNVMSIFSDAFSL
jgi:hypothetical protein